MLALGRTRIGSGHAVLHDFFAGRHLPAECGDLDDLCSEFDMGQPEPPADDPAVAKEFLDLIGMSRRPDVKVLGTPSEQQIADAAADQVGHVIVLA